MYGILAGLAYAFGTRPGSERPPGHLVPQVFRPVLATKVCVACDVHWGADEETCWSCGTTEVVDVSMATVQAEMKNPMRVRWETEEERSRDAI